MPWRHTHDPYKILVSEVMLQQTQVTRVLPKFKEFIKRFPAAEDLAAAPTSEVLRIWKGMGYNRRALYLQKAVRAGTLPKSEKELMKLPGVGRYTARAVLVFAHRQDTALIDTNIRQIITHFFFNDKPQPEKRVTQVAQQLVPEGKSWEWHQALMDYGAMALPQVPGTVKKQKKFEGSDRYYRGRVIDLLREGRVKESILTGKYSLSVIKGLMKDGLVIRSDGFYSLPT